MKLFSVITGFFLITACAFFNSCSCGNDAEIRDGDAKFRTMRDGILMITKKRCSHKPQTFSELTKCVERDSTGGTGYGTAYLSDFVDVNNTDTIKGSGSDIAFYYEFYFKSGETGKWSFEFGVDSGIASGCIVDEKELWFEPHDIWTLGDYSQVFTRDIQLNKGWHRVRIYGLEECCDGVWRVRYKAPSMRDYEVVSVKNLGVKCPVKL